MSIKISTNIYALRYSGSYLQNIGVSFKYTTSGPFVMCEDNPDFIITNSYHEALAASKKYPSVVFVGPNFKFPNYDFNIPIALLDELSVLSKVNTKYIPHDIAYFNNSGQENIPFINELQMLGNVKIMGPGYCIDELDRTFNQRLTPAFYSYAKTVASTSREETLKALFMGKSVISDNNHPYTYSINNLGPPRENQITYAWSLSHTVIWSEIFEILGYQDLSDKLKTILKIEENNETRAS